MINVILGVLLIQGLYGFAFETYAFFSNGRYKGYI